MATFLKSLISGMARCLLVLWLVVSLVHLGLYLAGGNPIDMMMDSRLSLQQREQLQQRFGYDTPPLVRYRHYLSRAVQGDFGFSFLYKAPVVQVLWPRIGKSLFLGALALFLAVFMAMGLLLMLHQARLTSLRPLADGLLQILLAVPAFVWAPLWLALFAYSLGWFPAYGSQALFSNESQGWQALWDTSWHAFLPALCLALPLAGQLVAYLHEQLRVLENAPFILSARGRGVSPARVFWNHQMRAILPAFIQWLGLYLPILAGGAVVIEAIFGWPGLGLALFDAVMARDYPLLLGGCIWATILVLPSYIMADWYRGDLSEQNP